MSEPKTECGCTDECLHKPGCVFEIDPMNIVAVARSKLELYESGAESFDISPDDVEALVKVIEQLHARLASALAAVSGAGGKENG